MTINNKHQTNTSWLMHRPTYWPVCWHLTADIRSTNKHCTLANFTVTWPIQLTDTKNQLPITYQHTNKQMSTPSKGWLIGSKNQLSLTNMLTNMRAWSWSSTYTKLQWRLSNQKWAQTRESHCHNATINLKKQQQSNPVTNTPTTCTCLFGHQHTDQYTGNAHTG